MPLRITKILQKDQENMTKNDNNNNKKKKIQKSIIPNAILN